MGQGSMMQMKEDLDQRLSILEKWERTLQSSITSIGLTYDATPSKIKDDKKKGVDKEKAGLTTVINSAQNDMNEIPDIE